MTPKSAPTAALDYTTMINLVEENAKLTKMMKQIAKFKAPADAQMQIDVDQEAQAEVPTTQMQITQNTQKLDAKKSEDMSSTKPADVGAAILATWSRMYPGVTRPKIDPTELKKLFPDVQSDPVLYKSYYLYMIHKKSLNENPLTFTAFKKYYTESVAGDCMADYESFVDFEDFE